MSRRTLKAPAGDELAVRLVLRKAGYADSRGDGAGWGGEACGGSGDGDYGGDSDAVDEDGCEWALSVSRSGRDEDRGVYSVQTGGGALNGQKEAEAGETDVDFCDAGGSGEVRGGFDIWREFLEYRGHMRHTSHPRDWGEKPMAPNGGYRGHRCLQDCADATLKE